MDAWLGRVVHVPEACQFLGRLIYHLEVVIPDDVRLELRAALLGEVRMQRYVSIHLGQGNGRATSRTEKLIPIRAHTVLAVHASYHMNRHIK